MFTLYNSRSDAVKYIHFCSQQMFTSVHYFIHLNLSIALLLSYVVFLAGVDTAIGNRVRWSVLAALRVNFIPFFSRLGVPL